MTLWREKAIAKSWLDKQKHGTKTYQADKLAKDCKVPKVTLIRVYSKFRRSVFHTKGMGVPPMRFHGILLLDLHILRQDDVFGHIFR